MSSNEYKCVMCGMVYEKDSFIEMIEELKKNFGIMTPYEKLNIVCNDCYQKINPQAGELINIEPLKLSVDFNEFMKRLNN